MCIIWLPVLGNQKQVQDKWINGHLTGVAKRKILLAHEDNFTKAIHEKWNHNANAPCWKFVWQSKLRTLWSFSSLNSLLKTGYRVWLEMSSIFLLLVLEKTLHGKEAFEDNKVQVHLLISLLKRLLVCLLKIFSISASPFLSSQLWPMTKFSISD